MEKKLTKGMVLCAGLGTRLSPITETLPKPLVPVLNVPNLLHSLYLLKRAGIVDIVLNLHHLPDQIENFLGDGKRWDLRLHYSREKVLLGTGGGVKKAEPYFEGKPFLLANCDFITDVDVKPFIARHFERKSLATMLLFQDEARQKAYSKVGVDEKNRLCSLPRHETMPPKKTGIFTGIHVLANETLSYLKEEPSGINEILYPALMKESPDRVHGEFMSAYWYDTGDLKQLWETSMELLSQLKDSKGVLARFLVDCGGYQEKAPGVWLPKSEPLPKGEIVGPVVIGRNCVVGKNAKVGPFTILSDDSNVEDNVRVSRYVGLGSPRLTSSNREAREGTMQFKERIFAVGS